MLIFIWGAAVILSLILCLRLYDDKKKRVIFGCIVPTGITIIIIIASYIFFNYLTQSK